ncbi:nuclear pore complex protein NUP98A-like [Thunnus maccoyii]|uniref:nuclear pore complex protein NUP98A-like n=1 Tax=Thunnus maccoyii TaxID=8240 RepID=UPI001C4DB8F9|nr:nuclear pore complex protein NUP98A-like [Thunnus maccoyii]
MALGLSLRVSWICLLFSSGACFPATKGDYKYPYTATWLSAGGSAPGSSNLQSGGSHAPLVSLQQEPSANLQQPAVSQLSQQQASSPTGNQSPSSLGAPSSMANRFLVRYDSSAAVAPSSGTGYTSPPVGTGTKTPSFSVQHQPAVGSSGTSSTGSYGPVYEAPSFSSVYPAGNAGQAFHNTASTGGVAAPVAYQDPFSDSSLSWDNIPEGAVAFPSAPVAYDPSAWVPSSVFPVWGPAQEGPQGGSEETSPLPPSSYIIQTRDGYQRAREAYSHMTYSPEYPSPVSGFRAVRRTGMSAPGTGSKGGQKV